MNERELEAAAAELIEQERYSDAEDLLRGVHDEAIRNNQVDLAICALQELMHIYVIQERLSDHERCQLEIEKLEGSAWSFVSSSWFYLYSKKDFEAAIAKADQAIVKVKAEGDTSTAYTARAARGQALIKLERPAAAKAVLTEMLGMVSQRMKLVPGDELGFLELAYSKGVARGTVAEILEDRTPVLSRAGLHRPRSRISREARNLDSVCQRLGTKNQQLDGRDACRSIEPVEWSPAAQ